MGNQNRKAAQKNRHQASKFMQMKPKEEKEKICPYCGGKTEIKTVHDILGNGDYSTKVYACSNYPTCDSYVRVIGKLPVTLADKELRSMRQRAHFWMDKVIGLDIMSVKEMYNDLRLFTGASELHLSIFRKEMCLAISERYKHLLLRHEKYQVLSDEELEKLYEPTSKYYMFELSNPDEASCTGYLKNSVTVRSGLELLNIIRNNIDDVIISQQTGQKRQEILSMIKDLRKLDDGTWKQVNKAAYEEVTKIHELGEE